MAVGMGEVHARAEKLSEMKNKELEKHLKENVVPVVLGQRKRIYIIDRHHLTLACWEADIEKVYCKVVADLSHLSSKDLWRKMTKSKWIYPYDQFGKGPHDILHMPEDVRGLANDPYRTLAWRVRKEGGFEKSPIPFAEFAWANYFRKTIKSFPNRDHIEEALIEALDACHSPKAKGLPGYKSHTSQKD